MNFPAHHESKKDFQLERFILFSDAVFAIAITLLVIEIKIPEIHENVSDQTLLHSLKHLLPKFAGFVISFFLIALYWRIHHTMFGFVINYNYKLLRINLIFLFFIVLMPFSTGFYSEYSGAELFEKQLKVPMTFYVFNYCCVGFINYYMWVYISNPKNKLIDASQHKQEIKGSKFRALLVPCIFLLMLPVAYFIDVRLAVYVPVLIPIFLRIYKRKWSKQKIAIVNEV
ncbi:MAG: TMEM175 family protein [Chitinophagaceae bacterium]